MRKILAFIKRDCAIEFSYKFSVLGRILRIFVTLVILYYFSQLMKQNGFTQVKGISIDYFPYLVIGTSFMEYLTITLGSLANNLRQEQMIGTFEALVSTPIKISTLLIGEVSWNFFFNSVIILIYILIGAVFFGIDIARINILSTAVFFALTVILFSGIGIIVASFIVVFKSAGPIPWLIGAASGILGNAYFPTSIMPELMQKLSLFLPVRYCLDGFRGALLTGDSLLTLAPQVGILLLFILLLVPTGIGMFALAIQYVKKTGALSYY
jgi:ABC-2 type transport system permease protein